MSAPKGQRPWRLAPYDSSEEKGLTLHFEGEAHDVERLLRAAPEMLAYLRDLNVFCERMCPHVDRGVIQALIAKVEGG